MKKYRTLAIVSGGMDSVAMLYDHQEDIEHVISFNYGSLHNAKELYYAWKHAHALGKKFTMIDMRPSFESIDSALLRTASDIPTGEYTKESLKSTVVPFRNGIMISVATGIADTNGYNVVLIGVHGGDHEVYPDCRPIFIDVMNTATSYGTSNQVQLVAPYLHMTKKQIAERALKKGFPIVDTYSCYKGGTIHCGECSTCIERKQALGIQDTTTYEI